MAKLKENPAFRGTILEGGKEGVDLRIEFTDTDGIVLKEVSNTKEQIYITFEQIEQIIKYFKK